MLSVRLAGAGREVVGWDEKMTVQYRTHVICVSSPVRQEAVGRAFSVGVVGRAMSSAEISKSPGGCPTGPQ